MPNTTKEVNKKLCLLLKNKYFSPFKVDNKEASLSKYAEACNLAKATISKINKGEGYEIPFYIVYQIIKFEGDNIHTFFEEFDEYLSQTDLNTKRGSN